MKNRKMKMNGGNLLNNFFNHKSDANKYLMCEEQEDLVKEFGEWTSELALTRNSKKSKL